MKKIILLAAVSILAGCMTVRTYTVEKPRTDTEVEGNRGYLMGSSSEESSNDKKLGSTRKVSVVEVEFGSAKKASSPGLKTYEPRKASQDDLYAEETLLGSDSILSADTGELSYRSYTVEKNDTLQKISQKFYGTTRKWMKIYNFNKDVLTDPDRLKVGVTLKIPEAAN